MAEEAAAEAQFFNPPGNEGSMILATNVSSRQGAIRAQTGLFSLCICGIFLAVLTMILPAGAEVLINEIMADPAGDWDGDGVYSYRDDEWVEVLNTGPETVDLTGYWLRDGTDEEAHINLFGVLAAGDVAVFTGSQAAAWQVETGQSVEGLSLNNGGIRWSFWPPYRAQWGRNWNSWIRQHTWTTRPRITVPAGRIPRARAGSFTMG